VTTTREPIRAIRGMNDLLPDDTPHWRRVEDGARAVLAAYGYREVRPPLLEKTELFRRSIGEVTDIVEKEMYTFTDRNGDSVTLRPECTASCVRMCIQHGMLRGPVQRLWHIGPMFRHERPQRGRYRQFHQVDVEIFGLAVPEADAELVLVSGRLWRTLGLEGLRLELNSLGTRSAQAAYRERLVEYLRAHRDRLDEDSLRRLETNPLRVLDSKNPEMQPVIEAAPMLVDHLDDESRDHLARLREILDAAGVSYRVNPRLVRGLDYYTRTVFEWVTDALGAQSAVCGGGRYDELVSDCGGPPTPATGFAIGLERLVELVRAGAGDGVEDTPHAYLVAAGDAAASAAFPLAERLRDQLPELRLVVDGGPGSFRSKLKSADRSGARVALLLGDDEVSAGTVSVKPLREEGAQRSLGHDAVVEWLARAMR